jgi:hypothetical protein
MPFAGSMKEVSDRHHISFLSYFDISNISASLASRLILFLTRCPPGNGETDGRSRE